MRKYQDRIVRDPQSCGGEPVVKGTRVPECGLSWRALLKGTVPMPFFGISRL
ncbi:MAG: DUF433 domain-containing protein [Acidiferrobacterales bacterium]